MTSFFYKEYFTFTDVVTCKCNPANNKEKRKSVPITFTV